MVEGVFPVNLTSVPNLGRLIQLTNAAQVGGIAPTTFAELNEITQAAQQPQIIIINQGDNQSQQPRPIIADDALQTFIDIQIEATQVANDNTQETTPVDTRNTSSIDIALNITNNFFLQGTSILNPGSALPIVGPISAYQATQQRVNPIEEFAAFSTRSSARLINQNRFSTLV